AIHLEPLEVAEPVSSASGKLYEVAEVVEAPSDILTVAPEEAAQPPVATNELAAPSTAAPESVFDVEPVFVAEPVSSVSGKVDIVAETVESPSDILSKIDVELVGPPEPAGSDAGKTPPAIEAADQAADLATLLGPEVPAEAPAAEDKTVADESV